MVNQNANNSYCIIGHRKIIDNTNIFEKNLFNILIDLIKNKNVSIFNFGFYGEFNDLCYKILINLKNYYPNIQLVLYSLNNEIAYTFEEVEDYKNKYNRKNKPFKYKCFDEIIYLTEIDESRVEYSYVLRNKKLIDESDFCLFYYKENYSLPTLNGQIRNSGTKIAYDYSINQKKKIILI